MTINQTESESLKPCPFCGSEEVGPSYATSAQQPDVISSRFVECADCAGMGPTHPDERHAAALWNTRAPTPAPAPAAWPLGGKVAADFILSTPAPDTGEAVAWRVKLPGDRAWSVIGFPSVAHDMKECGYDVRPLYASNNMEEVERLRAEVAALKEKYGA